MQVVGSKYVHRKFKIGDIVYLKTDPRWNAEVVDFSQDYNYIVRITAAPTSWALNIEYTIHEAFWEKRP